MRRRTFVRKGALWVTASALAPRIVSGFAGITQVQGNSTQVGGSGATSLAFGSSVASGNLLICAVVCSGSATVVTVTSTRATWARTGSRIFISGGGGVEIWWGIATSTGADTVSLGFSGGATAGFQFLYEFNTTNGGWPSNPTDGTATGSAASGTAVATGNLVTAGANDVLVVASSGSTATGSYTAGSGYVNQLTLPGGPNPNGSSENKLNVASGTYTGTFTVSGSAAWTAIIAGFKDNTASSNKAIPTVL